jgi:hypothetical protein
MKKIISFFCLLTLAVGGTLGATQNEATQCPGIAQNNITSSRLTVTTPFPIQGTPVEGGACEYKITAKPLNSRASVFRPRTTRVQEEKVPPLADCSNLHIGQAEVSQYIQKGNYAGVYEMHASLAVGSGGTVIDQADKKFTITALRGFTDHPNEQEMNVLEFMQAHNIDKLEFTGKTFGMCNYEAAFSGGRVEVIIR